VSDFKPRPYQEAALEGARVALRGGAHSVLVQMPTGCHALGQPIMMADRSIRLVETIQVGDQLMGPDGKPRAVLSLARGRAPMVRIIPMRGNPWDVNLDHVLTLAMATRSSDAVDIARDPNCWTDITVAEWLRQRQPGAWLMRARAFGADGSPVFRIDSFKTELRPEANYYGFELDGDHRYLLGDGTVTHNSGKSHIFRSIIAGVTAKGKRAMLLVQGQNLVRQAAKHLSALGVSVGVEMGDDRVGPRIGARGFIDDAPQIVVASRDSLARRLKHYPPDFFRMIVIDECFPAGTLVDGRPIETIKVGDPVRAYNPRTGLIELRPVVRLFKNPVRELVRLHLSDGTSIVCTPEHPFAVEHGAGVEYLPAVKMEGLYAQVSDMYQLRSGVSAQVEAHVLRHLQVGGELADHVTDEPSACVAEDDRPEPDATRGSARQGERDSGGDEAHTTDSRRQRQASGRTAATAGGGARMADGGCDSHGPRSGEGSPALLQDRHRPLDEEGGDRGGRPWAQHLQDQGCGRAQDGVSRGPRVDRVEILECAGAGGPGSVCPDGAVYNLEVDGLHNYFVNDILVHNCHHLLSDQYLQILQHFGVSVPTKEKGKIVPDRKTAWGGNTILIGLTATPDRGDHGDIMTVFEARGFKYGILEAIDDGWLVPIKQAMCHLDGLDLSKVRTSVGDLNAQDLEAVIRPLLEPICREIVKVADGRPTLIYNPLVTMAAATTEHLTGKTKGAGRVVTVTAETEEREAMFKAMARGDIWAFSSVGTLTEGVDIPCATIGAMLRMTKSRPLYAQIMGRLLRPAESLAHALNDMTRDQRRAAIAASEKPEAWMLDFAGNAGRHKLIGVADVIGEDEDDKTMSLARGHILRGVTDPTEAIAKAREDLAVMLAKAAGSEIERVLVDPFALFSVKAKADAQSRPPTEAQVEALLNAGAVECKINSASSRDKARKVIAQRFDLLTAQAMLDESRRRVTARQASLRQVRRLVKANLPLERARTISFQDARTAIDELEAQGWETSPAWIAKHSGAAAGATT